IRLATLRSDVGAVAMVSALGALPAAAVSATLDAAVPPAPPSPPVPVLGGGGSPIPIGPQPVTRPVSAIPLAPQPPTRPVSPIHIGPVSPIHFTARPPAAPAGQPVSVLATAVANQLLPEGLLDLGAVSGVALAGLGQAFLAPGGQRIIA